MSTSFVCSNFWEGQVLVMIGRKYSKQSLTQHKKRLSTQTIPEIFTPILPIVFLNGKFALVLPNNLVISCSFVYCQTQKTVYTLKISGILIVYWPLTIKFRIRKQTSKPQTNYRGCLRFSYLATHWLISRSTITFHKYFWYSRFCELHSN